MTNYEKIKTATTKEDICIMLDLFAIDYCLAYMNEKEILTSEWLDLEYNPFSSLINGLEKVKKEDVTEKLKELLKNGK